MRNRFAETVFVDLPKREQKRPEFLKMNPYGKVPVIVDGNAVLYESCIINEYLEETYPEVSLMPQDKWKRGRIRILIDYGINHFTDTYQKVRQELAKGEREKNRQVIQEGMRELKNLLRPLEAELAGGDYLAGEFSLLDAALIPRFLRYEEWNLLPDAAFPRLSQSFEKRQHAYRRIRQGSSD